MNSTTSVVGRGRLWLGYGVGAATTVATFAFIRVALPGVYAGVPIVLFVIPIVLSAYVGGLWPGLSCTALGAIASLYFALTPNHVWSAVSPSDKIRFFAGISVGVVVCVLSESMHSAQRRARIEISERKRAEEGLRRASAYNRSLIEVSLDPLVTIAPDGKVTDVNSATEKVTGLPREELIGTDFSDYFTEPEKARAGYQQVFREGWVQDYALEIRHRDGHVTPVLYNGSVYRDDDGQVVGVFATARDISERKRAEEALRRAGAYNRSLIEASLDPLVTISPDGRVTDVNSATEKVTGGSREELVGTDFSDYFTEPEKAQAGYRQVFREDSVQDYELQVRHRDGHVTPVLYNASVYRDDAGQVIGVFAAARDITERQRAEQDLRALNETLEQRVAQRTAELEASNKELEAFTYSVSHDLRAPLRHIDGFARMLTEEDNAGLSDEAKRYISRISEGTKKMGHLVDDLLNLARLGRREMSPQVTALSSIVEEAVGELKKETPERSIEWKLGPLPFVECDPGLMKQVFVNLLSNAVKYTRPRSQARIEVGAFTQEGQPVIFVRDNGVGFSMKYADKLFGVFQRLHRPEDFEGTGIGLATVQRILHRHGGSAWAEAELDRGATFYFTLGKQETEAGSQRSEGSEVEARAA